MIVVRLKGGLGNQLFQYAFGYILAKKNNNKLMLDIDWFDTEGNVPWLKKRAYELDKFDIPAAHIIKHKKLPIIPRFFGSRIIRRASAAMLKQDKIKVGSWLMVSNTVNNDYLKLPKSKNLFLNGYFDNHAAVYLKGYEQDICRQFKIKETSQSTKELIKQIQSYNNTTSIHVRRTDQMHETGHKAGLEYYKKAIQYMTEKDPDMRFFVFSDDIEWCKNQFGSYSNCIFATDPDDDDSLRDFAGMMTCKNNIIAYSTYSWWAAMLNRNETKIVITPEFYDSVEFLPESWVVIK